MRQFFQRMALEMSGGNSYLVRVDKDGKVFAKLANTIQTIGLNLSVRNCRCILELRDIENDSNDWGLYRL